MSQRGEDHTVVQVHATFCTSGVQEGILRRMHVDHQSPWHTTVVFIMRRLDALQVSTPTGLCPCAGKAAC